MIFNQNDPKMISKSRIIARNGILDPIEFWWVPKMPRMFVPKSSNDQSYQKDETPRFAEGDPKVTPR